MKNLHPRFPAPIVWLIAVSLFTIDACAPEKITTVITGSWKEPSANRYRSFFVVVLNNNYPVRGTLEADISGLLKKDGIQAVKSLDVFGKEQKFETLEEKQAAVDKIQSLGHDAIITVSVLRHTDESRYVEGTTSYSPTAVGVGSGYYNPATGANQGTGTHAFGTYYMGASSLYNTPGYYETDRVYFVQSNVYEASTAKLIWSAQSETFYPGNLAAASRDFSSAMVRAMKDAGIVLLNK
jgi:hypothetical protein